VLDEEVAEVEVVGHGWTRLREVLAVCDGHTVQRRGSIERRGARLWALRDKKWSGRTGVAAGVCVGSVGGEACLAKKGGRGAGTRGILLDKGRGQMQSAAEAGAGEAAGRTSG
jgi:hypothetical protein